MRFAAHRRKNPFDNPLLGLFIHLAATTGLVVAVYFALAQATFMPLYVVLASVTVVEGLWFYFSIRR